MKKNTYISPSVNLLKSDEFTSTLRLHANYFNTIRGGHLPFYISSAAQKRLAVNVNLLTSEESLAIIQHIFISKN